MSFSAGILLALLMMLLAVLGPASRTALFEEALLATVRREALGVSEHDLQLFADETMRYLRGEKAAWEPALSLYGVAAQEAIPQSFRLHMAQVRGWITAAPWVLGAGMGLTALLYWLGCSRRMPLWGLFAAVGLMLGVLLWAVLDFASLWMVLHRLLIPDGIFSAREPVMQLFPLTLFFHYVKPVALSLVLHLAAAALLLAAPLRIRPAKER